jgi:hypothetical protein
VRRDGGDLGRYGLRRSAISPLCELREHGHTAVIDVGTLARIKAGEIAVYPGIRRLDAAGAEFVDGRSAPFDAIVLRPAIARESRRCSGQRGAAR